MMITQNYQVRGRIPLDNIIESFEEQAVELTMEAAMGNISLQQYEAAMRQLIKESFIVSSVFGFEEFLQDGNVNFLRRAIFRQRVNRQRRRMIREQFEFLSMFVNEIQRGTLDNESLLGAILNRAKMYVNAGRSIFGWVKVAAGKLLGRNQKRRVLEPTAQHCPDCLEQAALGWVDIDDPRVTDIAVGVQCLTNDRCTIETRSA